MVQENVVVQLKSGLQARPAALFVQEANHYSSKIEIQKSNKKVNAKSIMGMMSIAIRPGEEITLIVSGPDENEALKAMKAFVSKDDI
ncbi:HPr-like protein Crh [Pullulanibacillus camelliae]|uniref:HPr-like protein Crh n=1 Tax=Pullulanibacillus camelliae TaxID=1707096 RepID=A0A8J2YGN6_9BACL|nr:HPr family phosphocarrier protein [Pullulanibacillus camelliae]GGE36594.1 HPr-like protein Crh [Pullulanibacillus camelliae]